MFSRFSIASRRHLPWAVIWLLGTLLVALVLARQELNRQRDQFDANMHSVQQLLEQKPALTDALLVALVQANSPQALQKLESHLGQTHPQVLAVSRRESDGSWSDEGLRAAESVSETTRLPTVANLNLTKGRYQLVLSALAVAPIGALSNSLGKELAASANPAEPAIPNTAFVSTALLIDIKAGIDWAQWPMARNTHPLRVALEHNGQSLVLQEGALVSDGARGWRLFQNRALSARSQPFVLTGSRVIAWSALPWSHIVNLSLALALVLLALRALMRQHHDRLRAGELLHLGQLGRFNTLGELAAGMSNELALPLATALQASKAAQQHLSQQPLSPQGQIEALATVGLAKEEITHASGVIDRLQHVVQRPDLRQQLERVVLGAAVRHALDVLAPELQRVGIQPLVSGPDFTVMAAPEALPQIIHNLVINALQALAGVPAPERSLTLLLDTSGGMGRLTVQDTGPGMANQVLDRIFEPFFTTRADGLGLGLSLCETFASGMGGTLTAYNRLPRGAEFCLGLRLAA